MASFRKKGRVWYYRFVDAEGVKRERKGATDRRVTEELARAAEAEAARVRAGLSDPKAEALRRHEARPLPDQLDDWHRAMLDRGRTGKHADLSRTRVRALSEAARVATSAVKGAQQTNALVAKLGESSAEIGNVIKVITSIAQQTNLLALNATIEATSAGDAVSAGG